MSEPAAAGAAGPKVTQRAWTLRRRLGGAFVVVAGVIALLAAAVVVAAVLFTRAGNEVIYRWLPANSASHRLVTDLVSQEAAVRGYALSADPQFLVRYQQSSQTQRADAARLRVLVVGDGMLGRRIDALGQAIDMWRATIAEPAIAAIRTGDPAGAMLVESTVAQDRFDAVRERAADLDGDLQRRTLHARDRRNVDGVVFGVAGGLLVLVVAASGLALWRGLHRWVLGPVDRLAAQTREFASGRGGERIVGDGPHELTGLGGDVESMRLQIASELARAEALVED